MNRKMKDLNCRQKVFLVITAVLIFMLILLIPMDHFRHGTYCEPLRYEEIDAEDVAGYVDVSRSDYVLSFSPAKDHLAGFEINLTHLSGEENGQLRLDVFDEQGKFMESVTAEMDDLSDGRWYLVRTKGRYVKDRIYRLKISSVNCMTSPYLQLVDNHYLPDENGGDMLLIDYAYSRSTFDDREKAVIFMICLAVWIFLLGELWREGEPGRRPCRLASLFVLMCTVFTWNYAFNSFDEENKDAFEEFQIDSDSLVISAIEAGRSGAVLNPFGLGSYEAVDGTYYPDWRVGFVNDENWLYGYSRTEPMIMLEHNKCTYEYSWIGTTIRFQNGAEHRIIDMVDYGNVYVFVLDSGGPLNYYKYGSLKDAVFISPEGVQCVKGVLVPYTSQYGFQGKVFRHLAQHMKEEECLENLSFLCAWALAVVLTLLVFLIGYQYDRLLAACFGVTFLLSPWITNFADSVYWVEFTWFLPMVIGLACSVRIRRRGVRVAAYFLGYLSILLKALCGYEYITAVMLGLISFPLVDLIAAAVKKDGKRAFLIFRTVFLLGISALMGFMTAISIHAYIRGEGSIADGIRQIIENDVLRRVGGGSLNDMSEVLWPSLNASVWDVVKLYFHFSTDIIAGIDANQFPILCAAPIAIFVWDYLKKKLNLRDVFMYIVFFFTGMSWIMLGKSHSYVHTHISFVMWYFGFVQICFYVIVKKLIKSVKKEKGVV